MDTQRTAIVTGAGRGIGAAVAKRLARDGFAVVVNYAGREADAQEVVRAIRGAGGTAVAVQADVSSTADVERLFRQAEAELGPVHVLVNNAGINPPNLPRIADTDEATFDRVMEVNVKGTFNTLRVASSRLSHGGRIVNFSTSVIGLALPGYAAYASSKAAVEAMTKVFANELRGKDVTVNAVAPGPTATDLFLDGKSRDAIDRLAKMPPLERLGTPEDIANVVAFLVGPQGGWVNGQTLRANGGLV